MKKGFTMIEIMAVFTIAAIILIIAIPQMTSLLKKSKENQMESFENTLFLAAEAYIAGEKITVEEEGYNVNIKDMLSKGYLDSTIVYPKTNKKFSSMSDEELGKIILHVFKDKEGFYIYSLNGEN